MITLTVDDKKIVGALKRLQDLGTNLSPALLEIGEALTESTKQRFADQAGPDGQRWPDNTAVTSSRKGSQPPLTGETGILGDTIHAQLLDNNTLEIGSAMEYAAMQQFGGTKAEFPHLWGDIPARPFLGISNQDELEIMDIINDHLKSALK